MAELSTGGLEAQIAQLEQEIARKRAELGTDQTAPYERTEVREVVGEQVQQAMPSYQPPPAAASASDVPSYQNPALAAAVQQLVNVAFTQSLAEAVAQARKTGNPALIDALHDILVDQLHQELLNRQKIEPAP